MIKSLATFIALALCSQTLLASECYQQSPNWKAAGDDYYNLDHNTLDKKTRSLLASIYPKLEGKWQGQLSEMLCSGPERAPEVTRNSYAIDSEVKTGGNASLHIQSNRYWKEERRRTQTSRHLFGPDGHYELLSSSDNHIEVSYKYRTRALHDRGEVEVYRPTLLNPFRTQTIKLTSTNSIFREQITRLERTDKGLAITLDNYVNGVLISRETALMKKQ